MGRGTSLVEAMLRGRTVYGNDINPLSWVLTEPRLKPPSLSQIYDRLNTIPWDKFKTFKDQELLAFYHPKILSQIEGLRLWLKKRKSKALLDRLDAWIQMVAVNRLTGHSSGFFSVYTLPPNKTVSVKRQKKINQQRGQSPSV